jgi:hypothetical protein
MRPATAIAQAIADSVAKATGDRGTCEHVRSASQIKRRSVKARQDVRAVARTAKANSRPKLNRPGDRQQAHQGEQGSAALAHSLNVNAAGQGKGDDNGQRALFCHDAFTTPHVHGMTGKERRDTRGTADHIKAIAPHGRDVAIGFQLIKQRLGSSYTRQIAASYLFY